MPSIEDWSMKNALPFDCFVKTLKKNQPHAGFFLWIGKSA
ncbi:hypothetical protein HBZS_124120 [Helicobacter bizzozeronii CCUG 35545]|nr:hypothetical protein HBZS_124120 [Helicobacter bizzozeronii CCUG 35545]